MATYIITEKQNINSFRRGERIEAANLTIAKRKATRAQMFQGTVMTIETESGTLLASKRGGKWANA